MSESCDVEASAASLMAARTGARKMAAWPSRPPGAFWESFAIHAAAARLPGHEVTGWKVGNINAEQQAKSGIPAVTCAPLLAPWTKASPARYEHAKFLTPKIECEIAFALGRDLPARKTPYSREEVADAVAAVHPAIEIVDIRLAGGYASAPVEALADCMASGGFVPGPACRDWRKLDLGKVEMVLKADATEVARAAGAVILGNPFEALVLLANNPPPWTTLSAGQIVTTGSCTVPFAFDKPGTFVADYGALGAVTVTFA
ncbi:MAG: 2-keto-4-pentenoate hydratase [Alphaproteobacteria bacterium]|nr:2-keto-4-pentenoate hydratase [Alphaproteobacteria bacterium]